ncbi:MAG: ATP-binding protein [Candidatus Aminicenantales bacterium]
MILSVASGKGGTGKTTIAVNLALSLAKTQPVQFLDCDAEEPNAHFFLKPHLSTNREVSIPVPEIIEEKCTFCGKCAEVCAYNALAVLKDTVLVFPELCHGCGGCSLLCPEKAIKEKGQKIGIMEFGSSNGIEFIHGKLDIGQAMSPPLIREIKKNMDLTRLVIIDAPPGTSCPMVESVKGSDFSLLVTEPTPFGLNDLKLSVETLKEMQIPFGVVINRAGVGDRGVEAYCQKENISLLMTLPFDREIAVAYSDGVPLVEAKPAYRQKFMELYARIEGLRK